MYVVSFLMAAYVAIVSAMDCWQQRKAILGAPRNGEFSVDAPATFGEVDVIIQLARKNTVNAKRTVFRLAITSLSAMIGSAASVLGVLNI